MTTMLSLRNAERGSVDPRNEFRKQLADDALDIVLLAVAVLLSLALVTLF